LCPDDLAQSLLTDLIDAELGMEDLFLRSLPSLLPACWSLADNSRTDTVNELIQALDSASDILAQVHVFTS
jgi:hypothetical protein